MSRKELVAKIRALIAEDPEGYVEQRLQATVDKIMDVAHEPVVRVVSTYGEDTVEIFELLPSGSILEIHRNDDGSICFDIIPLAKQQGKKDWCDAMVEEMTAHGLNAVRAPRWVDE